MWVKKVKNFNNELKFILKNQMENPEIKTTVTGVP